MSHATENNAGESATTSEQAMDFSVFDFPCSGSDESVAARPVAGSRKQSARKKLKPIVDSFQEEMEKLHQTKKEMTVMNINASIKTMKQKMEQALKDQHDERQKFCEDFFCKFVTLVRKLKADMKNLKREGQKLAALFEKLQITFQEIEATQNHYMKIINGLFERCMKDLLELEKSHKDTLLREQSELKDKLIMLESSLMMESGVNDLQETIKILPAQVKKK